MSLVLALGAGCDAFDSGLLSDKPELPGPEVDGGQMPVDDGGVNPIQGCMGSGEQMCARPNADATCVNETCLIVRCRDPYLDCDGEAENGCEATLDSPRNCGACRASCLREHVLFGRCDPAAEEGPCLIDHSCPLGAVECVDGDMRNGCETGFGDCDGRPENGCETALRTLTDCGGCGVPCASAEAEVSCATGECEELGCAEGFGDCRDRGCESVASDAEHCGECGNACRGATRMCHGGRCTPLTCADGTADCDGQGDNGCETALDDVQSCGLCDVKCGPYENAQPGCQEGQCTVTCEPGFADCDSARDNGCEVNLIDPATCGGCTSDCGALPQVASAGCTDGVCTDLVCEEGWDDCDGNPANGCEQTLSANEHCGGCNSPCEPGHATGDCSTGSCTISSCTEGFDDCNGQASDGCEAALDTDSHCGGCGNACQNGTTCQDGGCGCAAGMCPDGAECCDGVCVNTTSTCFPWPCIPGTNADENNCGGCGTRCGLFCCVSFE